MIRRQGSWILSSVMDTPYTTKDPTIEQSFFQNKQTNKLTKQQQQQQQQQQQNLTSMAQCSRMVRGLVFLLPVKPAVMLYLNYLFH